MTIERIAIGIGEALWDMLPGGKKIGGAPANFAYHIAQLGIKSCAVSAVGADELGNQLINAFNDKCINNIISTVDYPTGTVTVEIDGNGIPQYDIKQNVAWDNIPFTQQLQQLAQQTTAVCFGSLAQRNSITRDTIHAFINSIPKQNNPLIIFDINLRQNFYSPKIIDDSIKLCNILKINDEELVTLHSLLNLTSTDQQEECMNLLTLYPNLDKIILTCGATGSYVFTRNETSFIATPKVQVADTVGAGDSFTAAFIASLIKGKPIRQAHKTAVEVSAYVCTQTGAMPMFPEHLVN